MNIRGEQMRLYAVTDRTWAHDAAGLLEQVAAAVDGGAGVVQLREKHLEDAAFLAVQALARRCLYRSLYTMSPWNTEVIPYLPEWANAAVRATTCGWRCRKAAFSVKLRWCSDR